MQLNFLGFPNIEEGLGLFLSDVLPRFERAGI
jgi:hypothetical protein